MGVILLFFDGVGIGPADDEINPITAYVNQPFPVDGQPYHFQGGFLAPTDATLGIEGLPQSATGQSTILTGINAAAVEGRHVTAFPTVKLRRLLTDHSLLKQIKEAGGRPVFANAYHQRYFLRRETRYSVSTWSWLAAGVDYHTVDDLKQGTAVSHDLTNRFMNQLGFPVPVRQPAQTGQILAEMLDRFDFVLFEYILTDRCGHHQDMEEAHFRLSQIREMILALLGALDLETNTVLLTSDHGNLEDLSTNTHTRNKVPTILWGRHAERMRDTIHSIQDITPVILQEFT